MQMKAAFNSKYKLLAHNGMYLEIMKKRLLRITCGNTIYGCETQLIGEEEKRKCVTLKYDTRRGN